MDIFHMTEEIFDFYPIAVPVTHIHDTGIIYFHDLRKGGYPRAFQAEASETG
jgi:hypothetical protein